LIDETTQDRFKCRSNKSNGQFPYHALRILPNHRATDFCCPVPLGRLAPTNTTTSSPENRIHAGECNDTARIAVNVPGFGTLKSSANCGTRGRVWFGCCTDVCWGNAPNVLDTGSGYAMRCAFPLGICESVGFIDGACSDAVFRLTLIIERSLYYQGTGDSGFSPRIQRQRQLPPVHEIKRPCPRNCRRIQRKSNVQGWVGGNTGKDDRHI
jgi:hypothetical protein